LHFFHSNFTNFFLIGFYSIWILSLSLITSKHDIIMVYLTMVLSWDILLNSRTVLIRSLKYIVEGPKSEPWRLHPYPINSIFSTNWKNNYHSIYFFVFLHEHNEFTVLVIWAVTNITHLSFVNNSVWFFKT